jgi:HPt (histidine-containing phosphotransfer) domain-containing protein
MDYKFIKTEYLESVAGGDRELILDLVTMFRDQSSEIAAEMRTLLKKNEYNALGMLAHKAKSSVAIMGMSDLAEMLKTFELETKGNQENEKFESYISRFEQETKGAVEELNNFVSNLK